MQKKLSKLKQASVNRSSINANAKAKVSSPLPQTTICHWLPTTGVNWICMFHFKENAYPYETFYFFLHFLSAPFNWETYSLKKVGGLSMPLTTCARKKILSSEITIFLRFIPCIADPFFTHFSLIISCYTSYFNMLTDAVSYAVKTQLHVCLQMIAFLWTLVQTYFNVWPYITYKIQMYLLMAYIEMVGS